MSRMLTLHHFKRFKCLSLQKATNTSLAPSCIHVLCLLTFFHFMCLLVQSLLSVCLCFFLLPPTAVLFKAQINELVSRFPDLQSISSPLTLLTPDRLKRTLQWNAHFGKGFPKPLFQIWRAERKNGCCPSVTSFISRVANTNRTNCWLCFFCCFSKILFTSEIMCVLVQLYL